MRHIEYLIGPYTVNYSMSCRNTGAHMYRKLKGPWSHDTQNVCLNGRLLPPMQDWGPRVPVSYGSTIFPANVPSLLCLGLQVGRS